MSTVTGLDSVLGKLTAWQDKTESLMETRMARLCAALRGWAKTGHQWQNRRGVTEASIQAYISEVTPLGITAVLEAGYDAALWLELARGGEWSWLWQIFFNHREEITAILGGADSELLLIEPNPDVQSEYETAKAEMKGMARSG